MDGDVEMVTAAATGGAAMSHDNLVRMLRAIADRDGATDPLDSKVLGRSLGWTAAITSASLDAAKAQLLDVGHPRRRHALTELRGDRAHGAGTATASR